MADSKTASGPLGKFKSVTNIHWVIGLLVSVIVSFILGLIVVGIDNGWAMLIVSGLICIILAALVGFAVRLTSSATQNQTFWAALVTAGLGVHVVVSFASVRYGFDDFEWTLWGTYAETPLSGFVIFYGLVAALVATVGRRA